MAVAAQIMTVIGATIVAMFAIVGFAPNFKNKK